MSKQKLKVKWDGYDIVDIKQPVRTVIKKVWIEDERITKYRLDRDRILYKMFPDSREEILDQHK